MMNSRELPAYCTGKHPLIIRSSGRAKKRRAAELKRWASWPGRWPLSWITVHEPLDLLALVGVGVGVVLTTGLGQAILTTTGGFIAIALAMTPQQEPAA